MASMYTVPIMLGINWYDNTPTGVTAVTGIDESLNGAGGISILVSSPSGIYLYDTNTGVWLTTDYGAMSSHWQSANVYGVAFSPNFANDNTLFTLVTIGGVIYVKTYIVGENGWGADIATTAAPTVDSPAPAYVLPTYVDFAFPDGFVAGSSTTGKIFVSYSDGNSGYVVRVNTRLQVAPPSTYFSGVTDLQIGSSRPL